MAAVIPLPHQHRLRFPEPVASFFGAPVQDPVDDPPASPRRQPDLRVIPGGTDAALRRRQAPEVYRRRRSLAAALALAVTVAVAWVAVSVVALVESEAVGGVATAGATAPSDMTSVVVPALPPAPAIEAPTGYVVQSGDTLWSIAESLAVTGDIRPLVDDLADRAGGASLEAGQRIDLDGLGGIGR